MRSRTSSLALLAISMVLCASMLIGTTYAWFTDSVSSGSNKILAGNLDIELLHKVDTGYESVEGSEALFGVEFWEPGVVACETFKVTNEGTLALKYFLSMAVSNVNYVMEGETDTGLSLLDVLKVAVVKDEIDPNDREAALERAKAESKFVDVSAFGGKSGKLQPKDAEEEVEGFTESDTFTVIVWWEPTENDNEYNLIGGAYASDADSDTVGELTIDLTVNLVATQVPYEADAFGEDYDKDATWPRLGTGSMLAEATEMKGKLPVNVKNIYFCEYDESYGLWEEGAPVGATQEDAVRLFADGNVVYICVLPGQKLMLNENCFQLFSEFKALVSIDFGSDGLVSTENVTNMNQMFWKCASLTSLDLSGWDVSKVTNMSAMFHTCSKLEEIDLTGWDVSSVTSMHQMFKGCAALKGLDLTGWDFSKVTSMGQMFQECRSLTEFDMSAWDVSKVTIMSNMFSGCTSLTKLDMSTWNVSKLKKVERMFYKCSALETIYAEDWNNTFVADKEMFSECTSLPGYDEGKVSGEYAKLIANGGYFTAK